LVSYVETMSRGKENSMNPFKNCYTLLLLILLTACATEKPSPVVPIQPAGSLSFWFQIPREYSNGLVPAGESMELVALPGVGHMQLNVSTSNVRLEWRWDNTVKGVYGLNVQVPYLLGPARYHVAMRWDSERGQFNVFLNNVPWRVIGTVQDPWTMPTQTIGHITRHVAVSDFQLFERFLVGADIAELSGQYPSPDVASLVGYQTDTPMESVDNLKGRQLYTIDMGNEKAMADWRLEGPGILERDAEWLAMSSREADTDGPAGHIVYWPPMEFPDNFIAEWDFQPTTSDGLCIVFFAARGINGKDIFDDSITERTGIFNQYHSSDINCYHISWYANTPGVPGRITTNLRKNAGFHVVSNGSPGVPAGSTDIHHVTLMKRGGHIQLGVDGKQIINWTDDGQRYGPILGGGKIGLRQMKWTEGRYRNFTVWAVK
jgi:hypothetical protein